MGQRRQGGTRVHDGGSDRGARHHRDRRLALAGLAADDRTVVAGAAAHRRRAAGRQRRSRNWPPRGVPPRARLPAARRRRLRGIPRRPRPVGGGPPAAYALRWHAAAVPAAPVPATVLTVCAVPERNGARHRAGRRLRVARADGAVAMTRPPCRGGAHVRRRRRRVTLVELLVALGADQPRPGALALLSTGGAGGVRSRSGRGRTAAAGPGDDGGDRRRRGPGRQRLRDDAPTRARAAACRRSCPTVAPRRLDGGRRAGHARRDGRRAHRRARAAGRGGARRARRGWCSTGPATAVRRRRPAGSPPATTCCSPGRRRLRAGRGAGGVAAAGHRPRRAAGPGLAGGYRVSVVEAAPTRCAPTPRPGWTQIVAQPGTGPAMPLVDFVAALRRRVAGGRRGARPCALAPDGDAPSTPPIGPLPPAAGVVGDPAWPAGENCAFARDAAGASASASRARSAAGAVAGLALALRRRAVVPVARGADALGRRPGAGGRACGCGSDVAVASALLRPPFGALAGPPAARRRVGAAACAERDGCAPGGRRGHRDAATPSPRVAAPRGFGLVVVLVWLTLLAGTGARRRRW